MPTVAKKPARKRKSHGGARSGSGPKPRKDRATMRAAPAWLGLSEQERAELDAAAAARGLSLSGYLRDLLGLPPFGSAKK